ncbi:MAG: biopolymer transporter ExbD [Spirochaetaceae bacterium]|nr:biopolymer transporter ExbD [Spirochaetaceae bacterium]
MKEVKENQISESDIYFEKYSEDSFPDLTPLIDVVFMLIIFFLLTSTLIGEKSLSINLPSSSAGEISQTENIVIEIDKENNIFFQNAKTDFKQIEFILKDIAIKTNKLLPEIILRSDEECSFGTVVQLMDIIQNSGFDTISFAVRENQS